MVDTFCTFWKTITRDTSFGTSPSNMVTCWIIFTMSTNTVTLFSKIPRWAFFRKKGEKAMYIDNYEQRRWTLQSCLQKNLSVWKRFNVTSQDCYKTLSISCSFLFLKLVFGLNAFQRNIFKQNQALLKFMCRITLSCYYFNRTIARWIICRLGLFNIDIDSSPWFFALYRSAWII